MSLFASSCTHCGSKEHSSSDCPHGFFSSKCSKCGSIEHASDACPHGFFSSKCSKCGSTEHASSNCPHGFFSSKCSKCGSIEHASADCPHGFFSSACSNCGSKNHASKDCPNGLFSSKKTSSGGGWTSSGGSNSAGGSLLAIVVIIALLLALFAYPFKLIDPNFSPFKFNWLNQSEVWIFSVAVWLSLIMVISVLKSVLQNKGAGFEALFENAFLSIGLFTLSLASLLGYFIKYKCYDYFIGLYWLAGVVLMGIVYLIIKSAEAQKRNGLLALAAICIIAPFIYLHWFSNTVSISMNDGATVESNSAYKNPLIVIAKSGANIRQYPNKTATVLYTVPNSGLVDFLSDSAEDNNITWYKVTSNGQEGWVSKGLVEKQN